MRGGSASWGNDAPFVAVEFVMMQDQRFNVDFLTTLPIPQRLPGPLFLHTFLSDLVQVFSYRFFALHLYGYWNNCFIVEITRLVGDAILALTDTFSGNFHFWSFL